MSQTDKIPYGVATIHTPFSQVFLHGSKADLKLGEFLEVGYVSNFGTQNNANYLYFTSTLDPAVWGAELAIGNGKERIYLIEPTGPIEDDPNLTNQKYKGNPSMSYRSKHALKVVGEVTVWNGHTPEQIKAMKEGIAKLTTQGIGPVE
jgi:rifampin ADP-ribosylating transferase